MESNLKIINAIDWIQDSGAAEAIADSPRNFFLPPKIVERAPVMPPTVRTPPVMTPPPRAVAEVSHLADSCQSLEELRQALMDFDACTLKHTATNLVFGDGNPKGRVMLVGEAPGADEDRQGIPFVGLSGQLLDRIIGSIGLDRTSVYITNIVPWRPPGNRQPTSQEIALCAPFIRRHIELVNPEFLILVGGVSAKTLLDTNEGIMKLRGRWLEYSSPGLPHPIKTLATFHPAFLLRSPGQKEFSWRDMLMLKAALANATSPAG